MINEPTVQENVIAHMERNVALIQQIKGRGGDTQCERNIDCFYHTCTEDDTHSVFGFLFPEAVIPASTKVLTDRYS